VAAKWGEAEIEVHVDGDALPSETAALARQAATEGGAEFRKYWRKEMRRAGTEGAREFGKSLRDLVTTVLFANGAMRKLYETSRRLRTGFRSLGSTISTFTRTSLAKVTKGIRDLSATLKNASERNLAPFREGFSHIRASMDDLRMTFPAVFKALDTMKTVFRSTTTSIRDFSQTIREASRNNLAPFREGLSHLKVTMEDLRDAFPTVVKGIEDTRTAFNRATGGVRRFGSAIKQLGPDMEDLGPAARNVANAWQRLTGIFRNSVAGMRGAREGSLDLRVELANLAYDIGETSEAADEGNDAIGRRTERSSRRGVTGIRKLLSMWKRMPHGLRQAAFWIGLVVSAMSNLAVISSALGGGLVVLLTTVVALASGLGLAVAGFAGLFEEGKKLAAGAQASKEAFQDLGKAFDNLQTGIVNKMFENMAGSIEKVTNTLLPALEDEILAFSEIVGENLSKVFDALSSPEGVENFSALIEGFGPIFSTITDAAIAFGDAIADVLIISLPFVQEFADWIKKIAENFSAWTESEEGRARITEWFETAQTLMPIIAEMIGAAADAISSLVTPETLESTGTFFQSITDFLPTLGELLGVIGALNVFGLLAQALETVGALLAPLMPPLKELAEVIGTTLLEGLTLLMPAFEQLGEALAPVIGFASELLKIILPPLFEIIAGGVETIAAIIDIFVALGEAIFGTGEETTDFGRIVMTILGTIMDIFVVFQILVVGGLKIIAALLRGDTAGAFKILEGVAKKVFDALGIDMGAFVADMAGHMKKIKDTLDKVIREVQNFGRDVGKVWDNIIQGIKDVIGWFQSLFSSADSAKSKSSEAASTPRTSSASASVAAMNTRRILSGATFGGMAVSQTFQASQGGQGLGGTTTHNVRGGRTLNVAPGAIVIQGDRDPNRTAVGVVNRLAERIAG
jgi:hypothetical protein